MKRINRLFPVLFGSVTVIAVTIFSLTPTPTQAAVMQDYDALDIIECDLDGCSRTGVRCAPTCYTGFCCYFKVE